MIYQIYRRYIRDFAWSYKVIPMRALWIQISWVLVVTKYFKLPIRILKSKIVLVLKRFKKKFKDILYRNI